MYHTRAPFRKGHCKGNACAAKTIVAFCLPNFSLATTQYKMKGDTKINAIEYEKIYTSYDLNYNAHDTLLHYLMRQGTAQKKIFVRYAFAPNQDTLEYLLYNFNLHYHDAFLTTFNCYGLYHNFKVKPARRWL